jgi:hypothetical protein
MNKLKILVLFFLNVKKILFFYFLKFIILNLLE